MLVATATHAGLIPSPFFLLLIFPSSLGWFHFWNILLKTALKQHTPFPPLLFFYLTRKILFTERASLLFAFSHNQLSIIMLPIL